MGFSEGCITWFQSYLSEGIFFVSIENQFSDYGRISCGVPQGLILGPLLFLIYVNDMPQAVNSNSFLYADDSCLMFQHKEVEKTAFTSDLSRLYYGWNYVWRTYSSKSYK